MKLDTELQLSAILLLIICTLCSARSLPVSLESISSDLQDSAFEQDLRNLVYDDYSRPMISQSRSHLMLRNRGTRSLEEPKRGKVSLSELADLLNTLRRKSGSSAGIEMDSLRFGRRR